MALADDDRITAFGLFVEAYNAVSGVVERELVDATGVSGHEFGVLLRLVRTPGHRLRMTGLAGLVGLSTSGLTRLVDRLEAQGLVARSACPGDRRGLEATLTDAGREVVERGLPIHLESIQRHVVEPLGDDLEALERTMRVLRDSVCNG